MTNRCMGRIVIGVTAIFWLGCSGSDMSTGDIASGTGGASALSSMSCSGKAGAKRGQSMEIIDVNGTQRTFVYYAPMNLDPNKAVPFVIVPHGFTMTGLSMQQITGYNDIADREGFVVAYPDGEGISPTTGGLTPPWNVGTGVCGAGAAVSATGDDQGFVDAMIEWVKADQCVDESHIFMSGFSMGGYFSNETGCLNPKIHGIGPHSGGTHDLSACTNAIMPAMIFHGDADPLIMYSCGTDARDKWAEHNGCMPASMGVDTVQVAMGMCEYNKGCPEGGQVALCSFSGMGHCWAGGSSSGTAVGATFGCPGYELASELGWAFFKEYAW